MTAEAFFEKFDELADAPDSVSRIREIVLDMGSIGRLIPTEGSWPTRRLRTLATKIGSGATPDGGRESYFSEGIPLIRSMNVHFRGFDETGLVFLNDEQARQLSNVIVQPNDVLFNITGASIGRVTVAPPEMAGARVNQHVTIIRPNVEICPDFLSIFLASPRVQRMINEVQVGATRQALTKGMIEQFDIPVPSIDEQKRIVAKVDELMALCDRLETQQQERETRQAKLARASLARFAEAPTPANLDFLFHTSYDIAPPDFRNAILSLAIHGNLSSSPLDVRSAGLLGDVIELISGQHLLADEQNEEGRGIPYLTGPADFGPEHPIPSRWTEQAKVIARPGDILITVKGSGCGKTNVLADQPTAISRQLMAVRVTGADRDYVHLVLKQAAEHFQRARTGIAIPGISRDDVLSLQILLPPVEEQRRIVAKVRALMTLTDQLETQISASREVGANLLDAVVAEFAA